MSQALQSRGLRYKATGASKVLALAVLAAISAVLGAGGYAAADPFEEHRDLMIAAIRDGDHQRVGRLLDTPYVDVEDRVSDQELSYLYLAVWRAEPRVVEVLLDHGASPEAFTRGGASVWWPAIQGGAFSSGSADVDLEAIRAHQYQIAKLLLAKSFPFVVRRSSSGYGNPNGNVFHVIASRCGGKGDAQDHTARLSLRLARLLNGQRYQPVVRLFLRERSPRGQTPSEVAAAVAERSNQPLCHELAGYLAEQAN